LLFLFYPTIAAAARAAAATAAVEREAAATAVAERAAAPTAAADRIAAPKAVVAGAAAPTVVPERAGAAPTVVVAGAAATAIDDKNIPIVELVHNSPAMNPPRDITLNPTAEVQQQRRRNKSHPAARTNTSAEVLQQ
jgi:hypothetical protein